MKPEEDWPCFEIGALPKDDQELKGEIAIVERLSMTFTANGKRQG